MHEQNEPETYKQLISSENAAVLQEYMSAVVQNGTGQKLKGQSYEAAGKDWFGRVFFRYECSTFLVCGLCTPGRKRGYRGCRVSRGFRCWKRICGSNRKRDFDSYYENYRIEQVYFLHEPGKSIILNLIMRNHIRRDCNDRSNELWRCRNI